ncbi:sensor histidine kinase [Nonomuraea gerenzanensis]|uniref:histidine kinase n=1 Tax=Nonomuraea gerenzanensis TaxID=93944 RepID=A0A1M4DXX1_9ACTN|nr:nitrate- and nitrite sensing domain-containing protein [Nonomuraea gerenzanensis]UBU13736.1 nitrate- and nitrite sensing domain-containing protein [Nonomuraea gerenzanensis]SBO91404.1 sensor-like histidine kinase [Nonomuraea gerenzanensis]
MSPTRGRPIALKLLILLLVPLLSLVGLWAFAAGLTGGAGLRLLSINDLATNLARPSETVTIELQNERLASVEFLVTGQGADTMAGQRGRTDRAVKTFRSRIKELNDLSPELNTQVGALNVKLDQLADVRKEVDGTLVAPLDVIDGYSQIVDASFRMYDAMVLVPDMALYQQARAVTMLGEAKEVLSRERAVIAIVLARGRVEPRERESFTGMVATRRLLFSQALSHLDGNLRGPYRKLADSPVYEEFLRAEDSIKGQATINGLPAGAATWPIDAQNLWTAVDHAQSKATQGIVGRVTPTAVGMLVKIGVAGGVGLIAVVASILLSLRFRKRLVRELAGLRDAATELAEVRLAGLVKRLRTNTEPPSAAEVAPLEVKAHTSEVADIVRAFNDVQSTAVEAAVDQARLRHGVSQVFVNLARRNQSLLHRQLLQLDSMERATEAPETLADLFKLDHLTTRMRRHAESLIILSDQAPGRGWRNPVPILDVLRAAVAEVEEYERVEVMQPPPVALLGAAVTDVAHLMAELIENATLFSPPQTRVDVRSSATPHGLVVEVEDRGLGLPRTELDELNDRLTDTPEFDLAQSDRLGLFVVSRLAARHGIKVALVPSPYGGLTATVALPADLLADQPALAGK